MRRFFASLAGCVLLLFLSDLARAQSVDIQLRTAQGCIFLHPATADVKSVDLAKLADHQCNQGRVNGGIFYGLGWTVARSQQQAEEFIGMRTGLMVNGQFDG